MGTANMSSRMMMATGRKKISNKLSLQDDCFTANISVKVNRAFRRAQCLWPERNFAKKVQFEVI